MTFNDNGCKIDITAKLALQGTSFVSIISKFI